MFKILLLVVVMLNGNPVPGTFYITKDNGDNFLSLDECQLALGSNDNTLAIKNLETNLKQMYGITDMKVVENKCISVDKDA